MKKLLVLTAVVVLTASMVGCECCERLRRGGCFGNTACDVPACYPCAPTMSCDPCAPGGGGYVSGGYMSSGYATSGCATGGCAPGTYSSTPATVLPGPAAQ
jgi:uncharacterized membrane protein